MSRQKNDGRGRLGGRQAGTPNRTTAAVKTWLTEFLQQEQPQIKKDFAKLQPLERVQMYEKLIQYILPKQQQQQQHINFEKLTDEEISQIAEQIIQTEYDDTN